MATSTRVLTLAYVTGAQEKAQGSRAGPRDRRRSQKVGLETETTIRQVCLIYRVIHLVVDWVGLTWIISVPLSAQFGFG